MLKNKTFLILTQIKIIKDSFSSLAATAFRRPTTVDRYVKFENALITLLLANYLKTEGLPEKVC
jgi:hypothetical protein